MAIGWSVALRTGQEWIGYLAMFPAALCGYAWANRYERRAGVTSLGLGTEEETAARISRALLVLVAGAVVVALVRREWLLAAVSLGSVGPLVRATERRGSRAGAR